MPLQHPSQSPFDVAIDNVHDDDDDNVDDNDDDNNDDHEGDKDNDDEHIGINFSFLPKYLKRRRYGSLIFFYVCFYLPVSFVRVNHGKNPKNPTEATGLYVMLFQNIHAEQFEHFKILANYILQGIFKACHATKQGNQFVWVNFIKTSLRANTILIET